MLDPEVLRQELDRLTSQVTKKTEQEVLEETVMAELARLGGQRVTDDSIVQEGTRLVLPATMTPHDAVDFLHQYIEAQETPHTFTKTFRFRPLDGAAAFERALRRVFGNSGIGRPTWTFFGKIPPALISVDVGLHESIQVPQGEIEVPSFEGTIELGQTRHRELGHLFQITITCPRKYKANVEGLFKVIEEELHARSIYKGKAIDGQTVP